MSITVVGDKSFTSTSIGEGTVMIDGAPRALDFQSIDNGGLYSILLDNKSFEALVEQSEGEYQVLISGTLYHVNVADERAKRLAEAGGALCRHHRRAQHQVAHARAHRRHPVNEGDHIKKGQVLVVLESMKMENELKAPRDGHVTMIKVALHQAVEHGQVLLVLT